MLKPNFSIEKECWKKSYKYVAGVDEVGRGSLAGPVTAAAVIFKEDQYVFEGVNDSKLLSHDERVSIVPKIVNLCAGWGVGFSSVQEIDNWGIVKAVDTAMIRAIRGLPNVDHVLIDGTRIPAGLVISSKAIVKGDRRSFSISAASILAKVIRDELLVSINELQPIYGFSQHKGYGTAMHRKSIEAHGASVWHRKTFTSKYL